MSKPVAMGATPPAEPFHELDRYEFDYSYAGSQLKDFIYERSRRYFAEGERCPANVAGLRSFPG